MNDMFSSQMLQTHNICFQIVTLIKVNFTILANTGSFGDDTSDFNLMVLKQTSEL